jgi:hypothetical protein
VEFDETKNIFNALESLMNIFKLFILLGMVLITAAACQSKSTVCSPDEPHAPAPFVTPISATKVSQDDENMLTPAMVKIRGKMISVDQVVHGSLCEGNWRGVVFVDCDIQVAEWEEVPNFLDGCGLQIEEGTVIYVAAHNNQAYYKGCSCHYTNEQFPSSEVSSK